jgi:hypothetical protein
VRIVPTVYTGWPRSEATRVYVANLRARRLIVVVIVGERRRDTECEHGHCDDENGGFHERTQVLKSLCGTRAFAPALRINPAYSSPTWPTRENFGRSAFSDAEGEHSMYSWVPGTFQIDQGWPAEHRPPGCPPIDKRAVHPWTKMRTRDRATQRPWTRKEVESNALADPSEQAGQFAPDLRCRLVVRASTWRLTMSSRVGTPAGQAPRLRP